jgi:hypothetical protein
MNFLLASLNQAAIVRIRGLIAVNAAPVSTKALTLATLEESDGFPISIFTIGPLRSRSSELKVTIKGKNYSEVFSSVQKIDRFMLTNLFDQEPCLMSEFFCAQLPKRFRNHHKSPRPYRQRRRRIDFHIGVAIQTCVAQSMLIHDQEGFAFRTLISPFNATR